MTLKLAQKSLPLQLASLSLALTSTWIVFCTALPWRMTHVVAQDAQQCQHHVDESAQSLVDFEDQRSEYASVHEK